MNIEELKLIIKNNLNNKTDEVKRVFHGRGNFYRAYNFLTIDSIDKILYVSLFEKIPLGLEEDLKKLFLEIYEEYEFETLLLQKRFLSNSPIELIKGELKEDSFTLENDLKYTLNFKNKNIGLFFDMKKGREFISSICENKNVLNLFSYTCAFSVVASKSKASKVVNVDMSKGALSQGRKNHHINNLDTKNIKFMPYNILKSWSRIRKDGPYDIIIIDPPSFQKGSFAATKDYEKIIKKLDELANDECVVLACLNAPELDVQFLKDIFSKNARSFQYVKRLSNLDTFPSSDEERSLKNLVFKK
ncbi:class I SAM-dependent methyltransferase [Arcobacter roscoffensis]|uniref:Class I SAM-dependent methyltransferase n=1 Tax=Arcobacter roscoffensis TaxID=2961520 RepID=A0ABY5DZX1_9BACT|nr:class I SAM-dependent methyltransferase [Arcobacter roscoffensis]UTJ05507.1 class I SAM-dependent methyltransferase [Arcobacter roscoffensis]